MLGNRSNRGAKRRFLVLLYLTCFTISMTPTIVAPPERGFSQGQPEMHQAMDNMVSHGILVKKTGDLPAIGAANYPAMLTAKTSSLLDEAEHMLSALPNSMEKQWIQAFVQRMRTIAKMLEETAEMSKHHLRMNLDFVNGTPVPEVLPPQPTWPDTFAVPGLNPVQKSSKTSSKFPVTSSELSKVLTENKYPSESPVITKPAMLSRKREYDDDDDELVRELENLHQEVTTEVPVQNSKVILPTIGFTTPATPIFSQSFFKKANNLEEKRAKLKEKLLKELAEYQHLGGDIPKELISALEENKDNKGSSFKQRTIVRESEDTNAAVIDKSLVHNLNNIENEDHQISQISLQSTKSEKNPNTQGNKYLYLKANYTFQNPHLILHSNFPTPYKSGNQFPYRLHQHREQPYQTGLETQQMSINVHDNDQATDSIRKQSHASNALMHKMQPLQKSIFDGHLTSSTFKEHLAPIRYRPYHYPQQWNKKNSTVDLEPETLSYFSKSPKNHQIDTQLNDEMKRQLRDGKIVILSDSVVRLNLETSTKEGISSKEINKENVDKDKKNNTTETLN